jgi:hypothetical protein
MMAKLGEEVSPEFGARLNEFTGEFQSPSVQTLHLDT